MKRLRALALMAGVCACGKLSIGPIDGHYRLTAWACGNTDVQAFLATTMVSAVKLTVTNATGMTTAEYQGDCVRTQPFTATYPTADSATFAESAPNCTPGCTVECQGYVSAISTFTFERKQALRLTRVLTQGDLDANDLLEAAGCTAGQIETRTLEKL